MTPEERIAAARAEKEEKQEAKERKGNAADVVVEHVLEHYDLHRDLGGLVFAVSRADGAPRVTTALGGEFRARVAVDLYRDRGAVVSKDALTNGLEVVQGLAALSQPTETFLRVAKVGDYRYTIDLGDADGNTVMLSEHGWEVASPSSAGPIFRRTNTIMELPRPETGGTRDAFRKALGLNDQQFAMIWGWVVAANFSDIARPVLWGLGVQGSGKTTALKAAMSLINPAQELGKSLNDGSSEAEAAYGRYVPSYDNVQTVKASTSEFICTLVTGVAVDKRQLYTDDVVRTLSFRRAALATSRKVPNGLQDDALERCLFVPFDRIAETERATESQIARDWAEEYTRVLGALYDDMSAVLKVLKRGVNLETRPRMADYAEVLAALDEVAPGYNFLDTYLKAAHATMRTRAADDPLIEAIASLVPEKMGGEWRGTMKTLLAAVQALVPEAVQRERWFPTVPKRLGDLLREHSESMRAIGIEFNPPRKSGRPASLKRVPEGGAQGGAQVLEMGPSETLGPIAKPELTSEDDKNGAQGTQAEPHSLTPNYEEKENKDYATPGEDDEGPLGPLGPSTSIGTNNSSHTVSENLNRLGIQGA